MRLTLIICAILITCQACKNGFSSESDFYKWWHMPENGLIKTKIVGDFKFSVKYMPPVYQVMNELGFSLADTAAFDSLYSMYKSNMTFLVTIEPEIEKDTDILFKGVTNYEEYKSRLLELNFKPAEFISLYVGKNKFKPVLSNMENIYNLSPKKTLYIVFSPDVHSEELYMEEDVTFEFSDHIFMTGINKFAFKRNDLLNIPEFIYTK